MATTNFGVSLSRPMSVSANERRVPDDTATAPARPRPIVAAPFAGEPTPTPISTQHQRISDALDRFEDDVAPILNGEQAGAITPEGRSEMVHDAALPILDAINQAEAAAADLASAANDAYKKTRAALSPRAASATDALNHSMWWQRTSRELDSVPTEKVVAVCQQLIADAAPDELGWLATELPSYLRSRSLPTGWLDAALHQVHPGLRRAAERRRLAHQAADIIASNARSARKALGSAASGSYKRPRLVSPSPKYDPDAQAELVGADRRPTTRDGHRP
jgi:hypothetical protein